jgi:hypothetical protein
MKSSTAQPHDSLGSGCICRKSWLCIRNQFRFALPEFAKLKRCFGTNSRKTLSSERAGEPAWMDAGNQVANFSRLS